MSISSTAFIVFNNEAINALAAKTAASVPESIAKTIYVKASQPCIVAASMINTAVNIANITGQTNVVMVFLTFNDMIKCNTNASMTIAKNTAVCHVIKSFIPTSPF